MNRFIQPEGKREKGREQVGNAVHFKSVIFVNLGFYNELQNEKGRLLNSV